MKYFLFLTGLLIVSFLTGWGAVHLLRFRKKEWYRALILVIVFYLLAVLLAIVVATVFAFLPNWAVQVIGTGLTGGLFVGLARFFYREKWQLVFLLALIFFAALLLFDFIWMSATR